MKRRIVIAFTACAAVLAAQAPPVSVLEIETANHVQYVYDTYDHLKFGRTPSPVAANQAGLPFVEGTQIADIVAVNGKAVRGTCVTRYLSFNLNPVPGDSRAIADTVRTSRGDFSWEIQREDGRAIGSIYTVFLGGGPSPPGAPPGSIAGNQAILGGSGAFTGIRGTSCQKQILRAPRVTSVQEDPANRRNTGGGALRFLLQVFPMNVPEIAVVGGRPAVYHAGFSPVTESAPARAGEQLILMAGGLGPTQPVSQPGEPFKADPVQEVTSPVEVIVNGAAVEAIYAVGWPGTTDRYRADFRVPEGTKTGVATLQLSVAWIKGPETKLPVR